MTRAQRKYYLNGVLLGLIPCNGIYVDYVDSRNVWELHVVAGKTEKMATLADSGIDSLTPTALAEKITKSLKEVK